MARQIKLTEANEEKFNKLANKMNMSAAQIVNALLSSATEVKLIQRVVTRFVVENENGDREVVTGEKETEETAVWNRKESNWKVRI